MNELLELWALSMTNHDAAGPFDTYQEIYNTIDKTQLGEAPWKCFHANLSEEVGEDSPRWKRETYNVYFRDPDTVLKNMLDNPDFDGQFDTTPYVHLDADGKRKISDYMSANYAWRQCVSGIYSNCKMV